MEAIYAVDSKNGLSKDGTMTWRSKKDYACDLFFNYDYSKEFKEEIVQEDNELIIKKYEKSILPSGSTYLY